MSSGKRYYNFNSAKQPAVPHVNIPASVKGNATIVTSDYNVQVSDSIIVCNSAAPITITLRQALAYWGTVIVKNINTGLVTVKGIGSPAETIDAEAYQYVYQWDCILVIDYFIGKWIIV